MKNVKRVFLDTYKQLDLIHCKFISFYIDKNRKKKMKTRFIMPIMYGELTPNHVRKLIDNSF